VRHILFGALVLLTACTPAAETAERRAPPLAPIGSSLERPAYVVDMGGMLLEWKERAIAERLNDFERRTHHQFVVVTVPSTNGRDIAEYTRDLGNRWGVGRQGHDDGVILLFAAHDRKLRIAVGDGLTRQLPDAVAAEIIRDHIVPGMRAHAPEAGVTAGVDAILARLEP